VNFATSKNKSGNPTLALKWAPSRDVAIRGSYSTGYQPPYLNALVQNLGPLAGATVQTLAPPGVVFDPSLGYSIVSGFDPLRGNEQLGTALNGGLLRVLPTTIGGNTEVLPQTSRSWSIGGILTPRFVPGLRVSVDWTRIELSNVYFSPIRLLGAAIVDSQIQRDFADFLRAYPERFPRAAPVAGDPYQVGRIISADISTANFSRQLSEALDIGVSYDRPVAGGNLNLLARATISLSQTSKLTPSSPEQDVTDVITDNFSVGLSADGGNDFKANGTLTYSTDRWSIGGRLTYFSGYWLQIDHSVVLQQGAARIRDQYYFDVFGSVKLFGNTDLRAGINNVLDRDPPIVARDFSGYSRQGKPWGTNFFLSISHRY
jgi:outer membrane receptor protein involved in Fe transport